MLDPTWWRRAHGEIQEEVPLLDAEIAELRRRLFIEALRVHRAFVQAAWRKIKPTLGSWANLLGGRSTFEKPETIAAIWRTAFLVVPVISTTFASVGRMLRDVPSETFGWAIVDEAGQAVPQAAVGLFRLSRRALVVGDPSQILPVVPLGERLVRALPPALRRSCGLGRRRRGRRLIADAGGPRLSSRNGARRRSAGERDMGRPPVVRSPPLRRADVHDLSNEIAYEMER